MPDNVDAVNLKHCTLRFRKNIGIAAAGIFPHSFDIFLFLTGYVDIFSIRLQRQGQ
jgi:hypothetical protein